MWGCGLYSNHDVSDDISARCYRQTQYHGELLLSYGMQVECLVLIYQSGSKPNTGVRGAVAYVLTLEVGNRSLLDASKLIGGWTIWLDHDQFSRILDGSDHVNYPGKESCNHRYRIRVFSVSVQSPIPYSCVQCFGLRSSPCSFWVVQPSQSWSGWEFQWVKTRRR